MEQLDHPGDPPFTLLGTTLRGVDPTKECPPIELRQTVKERPGGRLSRERRTHVLGEIITLRSLRHQDDIDDIAGGNAAISSPCRTEHDPEPLIQNFDRRSDVHSVHGAVDPMLRLAAPDRVRIKRHGHHHTVAVTRDDDGRVPL